LPKKRERYIAFSCKCGQIQGSKRGVKKHKCQREGCGWSIPIKKVAILAESSKSKNIGEAIRELKERQAKGDPKLPKFKRLVGYG